MFDATIGQPAILPLEFCTPLQRLTEQALACLAAALDRKGLPAAQRGLLLKAMNALDDIDAIIENSHAIADAPCEDEDLPEVQDACEGQADVEMPPEGTHADPGLRRTVPTLVWVSSLAGQAGLVPSDVALVA